MFRSFFLAGFECATGYNRDRQWIDQIAATEHDRFLEEDYERLKRIGIHTAREGVRWPLVDAKGRLDLSHLDRTLEAARNHGIEILHDLFHYGYPADLDIFSDEFRERFAAYCYAVASRVILNSDGPCFFTAVNEPSYFSWAAGEVGLFAPHEMGRGYELKQQLVRTAIEGINAIWSVSRDVEIVTIDPVCHVVPSAPEFQRDADGFNNSVVFQSMDMLAGRLHPELGGSMAHLGTVGINYYWKNQWVLGADTLPEDDLRRVPLREIVRRVYERYGTDVFLSETAHVDDRRSDWLSYATEEMIALIEEEVPVKGICLYPILGMPEWHEQHIWTRMGLWDLHPCDEGHLERRMHIPLFDALVEAQCRVERVMKAREERDAQSFADAPQETP